MASKVVSLRLDDSELKKIDQLAANMAVDRTAIMRRLILVGLEGLLDYERSSDSPDWPREGRMKLRVVD